ncbi:MAG: lysophospholipid acyltransferase family protein [Verrucomicrobiota bacterium]|nr:lysophospholipid acyltransferase family protein [Verrucomicrobiota bacterium]
MRSSLYQLPAFKAAFACARFLPRAWAQACATFIARASYARNPAVRNALHANLAQVTGRGGGELDALCEENVACFSRMLADYFACLGSSAAQIQSLLKEWRGLEHFQAARARGRGAILVTAHLGHWELGGILLALLGLPITVITLDEPTTELTRWRDQFRRRLGIRTITVGAGHDFAFIEMIQTLRRNEVLAMLIDRPYGGSGAPVRFFERPTEFSPAPALLWQHTGAAVIPAFVLRESSGDYTAFADPGLRLEAGPDPRAALVENTQRIASHFECIIRAHPEQWFNYVPIWNPSD